MPSAEKMGEGDSMMKMGDREEKVMWGRGIRIFFFQIIGVIWKTHMRG